jgi:hypothetical protein|uniref:hypothetical protein n=1 Tax=Cephaloticoccus sp. TaxID=1985742 RepID=UPI00404AA0B0
MKRLVWLLLSLCALAYVQVQPVAAYEQVEMSCCCDDAMNCTHDDGGACVPGAVCNICPPCTGIYHAVLSGKDFGFVPAVSVIQWTEISTEGPQRAEQPALPPPREVS